MKNVTTNIESAPENPITPFLTSVQKWILEKLDHSGNYELFGSDYMEKIIYDLPYIQNQSNDIAIRTKKDTSEILNHNKDDILLNQAQMNDVFQAELMSELLGGIVPHKNDNSNYRDRFGDEKNAVDINELIISEILTPENLRIILESIIVAYTSDDWLFYHIEDILPLMKAMKQHGIPINLERLSSQETREACMQHFRNPAVFEFYCDYHWLPGGPGTLDDIISDLKEVHIALNKTDIDEILMLFYKDGIKNYGEEGIQEYMGFFAGYETRLEELISQESK